MAIRSPAAKEEILDALLTTKRRAQRLALRLRLLRRNEESDRVRRKARRLAREIDTLIGRAMSTWLGEGEAIQDEIRALNRRLQRSITSIKRGIDISKNVVKTTGLLDDAIQIAVRLAA